MAIDSPSARSLFVKAKPLLRRCQHHPPLRPHSAKAANGASKAVAAIDYPSKQTVCQGGNQKRFNRLRTEARKRRDAASHKNDVLTSAVRTKLISY